MTVIIDCPYVENDDLLRQYLAGTVADSDAEEFERHLFACDRCREEVEQGLAVRAALQRPAHGSLLRWRFPSVTFAAAAAAVILVAIGLWQMRSAEPTVPQPVRGSERGITASARLANGAFTTIWQPNPSARQYVVQLFTADGTPLQSVHTSESKATVPLGSIPRGKTIYWKIQALDENGTVIGSSELQRITISR